MTMKELIIKPIGLVRNSNNTIMLRYSNEDIKLDKKSLLKNRMEEGTSEIIINEEYIECLDGIEDFSHLVIIYWTHKTPEEARQIKKVHPAGQKKMPIKGIFATRSPVRPNPIGIISVKLIERNKNILIVEGLDAINKTPIIDIKPHLPSYDSPLDVKLADWMHSIMDEFKELTSNSHINHN
ncbi:MAG: tRNA (N6-threonylcarbamoyladenosine(37)-N6)-methyltransferase TrmO [Candidatus Odinarchaeota archaeon]